MSILCAMVGATFGVAAAAEVIRAKKGITAVGNAQIDTAQSKFGGSSAQFDGTDDYIIANGNFTQTGDFTIECWFRPQRVTGAQILMTIGNEATDRCAVFLDGSTLKYDTFGSGGVDITCSGTISTNTWYHVAAVRSGTTLTIYRDGSSVGSGTLTGTVGNSTNAYFGADSNSVSDFQGHIDEVRYSNTARYTANFTPSTTPFVNDQYTLLLLHMDGTDASTYFEDDNGQRARRDGLQRGTGYIATAQSKFGGSSYFNNSTAESSGNCVEVASTHNSAFSFTGDFTIEGWYRATNFNAINALAANWPWGFYFSVWSNNRVKFEMTSSGGGSGVTLDITGISPTFATNTWYHMAAVRSGSTVTVYRDGVSLGSSNLGSHTIVCDDFLTIGANTNTNSPTQGWPGFIDEFRISNTARYTGNFTPSTTPFVNDANTLLLMHMDGTNNTTVFADDNNSNVYTVKNTLTGVDMAAPDSKPYQTVFMGDDSSQNPIFAYGYRDNSDFYIKIVAFKVNKKTGDLTIGTPVNVIAPDGDNNLYSVVSLVSENMDAATRTTSYSNFGYIGFYHGNSTNLSRIFAFSVDTSTLGITVGSGLSHSSSVDSGVTSLMYVGNSRVVFGMRGGSSYRYYNMFSRSGTTLTSQASGTLTANAAGGNFKGSAAVNFSGSSYRFATISDGVGLDVGQFVNTTLYSDSETQASVLSNANLASNAGWVIPLNTTDKFLLAGYNSTNTTLYAQAVSVNWGSTTPTNTLGTTITLTGNDVSPLAFAPGRSNDEAYYIYESGSTIRYRRITASGTTLTQGGEIDTGISSTNLSKVQRYDVAKSGSGDYLVGVVDDPSNTDNQVVIFKLD